jgi:general secretion pathway protein L
MMAAVSRPVGRFFAWWLGELGACVPAGLRGMLNGRRHQIAVDYREREVELYHRGRNGWRSLGKVPVDSGAPAAGRAACSAVLRGIRRGSAEIVLRLPADKVLRRRVELPLAAVENLREVLAFEMDRLTPFRAADAAYDYRVFATNRETQRVTVDLAVAPAALVDEGVHVAAALNLSPDRVGVANGADPEVVRFNLLSSPGDGSSHFLRRLNIALAAVFCLLLAAAALWPLHREQQELATLEARLQQGRTAAAAAEALRTRLAKELDRKSFLAQRRQATPLAVAVLKDLTERLADDSWLVQLHMGSGQLMLSGYAPAAAALVPVLEDSDLLSDVRFSSPVMPDSRISRERFNLSAKVAGMGGG